MRACQFFFIKRTSSEMLETQVTNARDQPCIHGTRDCIFSMHGTYAPMPAPTATAHVRFWSERTLREARPMSATGGAGTGAAIGAGVGALTGGVRPRISWV